MNRMTTTLSSCTRWTSCRPLTSCVGPAPLRWSGRRRGSVLLLVLVVVMLLSFSAYSFSELMIAEYSATVAIEDQLQTQVLAESGLEAAAAQLDAEQIGSRKHLSLRHYPVTDGNGRTGRFSVVQELPASALDVPVFGLRDESARLNLNALPLGDFKRRQSRERLMGLPEMTEQIADAILDWMDEDDEPSEFGAESEWYAMQSPPVRPAQRRLQSLEELLLVRGVTAELLYGEDTNRNGRLDYNENDGRRSAPNDNGDGRLDRGWLPLLTLHSRESVRQSPTGRSRINVNQDDLSALFDALEAEFDLDVARFITGWRMAGSLTGSESQRVSGAGGIVEETPGDDEDPGEARKRRRFMSASDRLREQLRGSGDDDNDDDGARDGGSGSGSTDESGDREDVYKGGMNLSRRPVYVLRSVVDLIGSSVRIDVDRRDTVLKSPWADDPASIDETLLDLTARLATSDETAIAGRINVNEAPPPVLMTVPGMTESLAASIVAAQQRARGNGEVARHHRTIGWLYAEGLVDLRKLRELAPYLTTRGDVFSGVSIGHLDGCRTTSAINFLMDASGGRTRILSVCDHGPLRLPVEEWR